MSNIGDFISRERYEEMFRNALYRISEEYIEKNELLKVFREEIGLTDEEIDYFGYDFSDLEQDNRISVFCLKDYEDAVFFTTEIPNDLYCVSSVYHYYMKNNIGRHSLDSLAGCFADKHFIDEQVFSVLCSAMPKDSRIASLIEFDFDSNQLNYCDNADSMWQTFDLEDISEAVSNSNKNKELNYAARENIFKECIADKEISSTVEETDTESESPSMSM